MVEPVYPFQRRELDGFERAPSCSSMDELGLIEAIEFQVALERAASMRLDVPQPTRQRTKQENN